jgi:hypothetical protein
MYIEYDDRFIEKYLAIYDFIASDSINRANIFENNLKETIRTITHFPYKHRQSIYFDREDIRDLVFMGYTLPFKIDEDNNRIIIISIVKYQKEI